MPSLKKIDVDQAIHCLRDEKKHWSSTSMAEIQAESKDPFRLLVATLMSARTKDDTTLLAARRLFKLAKTPKMMLTLPVSQIEKSIYPVGFYKTKSRNIKKLCRELLSNFNGKVPETVEELITLSGVGRKTANLVVTMAFAKHGICVDTHVHRISNRWKIIATKTAEESEQALYRVLPQKYWIEYNDLLVKFGQNICRPISPHCSECPILEICPQFGVR